MITPADFAALTETDLVARTDDQTTFPVPRVALAGSSLVFRAALGSDEGASAKDDQGRAIMDLPGESAKDVELLLRFVVPEIKRPLALTFDQVFTLLRLAKKYDAPAITDVVRTHVSFARLYKDDNVVVEVLGACLAGHHLEEAQQVLAVMDPHNWRHGLVWMPSMYVDAIDLKVMARLYKEETVLLRDNIHSWPKRLKLE